jgi:hypothetical protein
LQLLTILYLINNLRAHLTNCQDIVKTVTNKANTVQYWWVNHKQTFSKEFEGGYIWSPLKNKDNTFNRTYTNLTGTSIGDIVFSYAGGLIKAIGVVEENCIEAQIPPEFGQTGEQWNPNGHLVKVNWARLPVPFRPKDNLQHIAALLPTKFSPIQTNGNGNQKFYLTGISSELGTTLINLMVARDRFVSDILDDLTAGVEDEIQEKVINDSNISSAEKVQLIKARTGQGVFRNHVLEIESQCRITKVKEIRLLIASHIKPWRYSSNREKLDGNNGLLLSPHVDKLFDRGWITFSGSGKLIASGSTALAVMSRWNMRETGDFGKFTSEQSSYLEYHRDVVFNPSH